MAISPRFTERIDELTNQSTTTTVATKTRVAVDTVTKIMASVAILAATGGFVAAVAPLDLTKVKPVPTGVTGVTEVRPPQFNGLLTIEHVSSISPVSPIRKAYFSWQAGVDINGSGQSSPLTPLRYELYEGLSHYNENFNQPVWSTTAIPYWATRAMRYLISRPSTAGTFYILRARDPQGNQEQNVREVVWPMSYALTVTTSGSGNVRSDTGNIKCPTVCSATYKAGTVVKLTATAGAGYAFSGWSGVCSGTVTTCTVTMDAAKSASARFRISTPSPKPLAN